RIIAEANELAERERAAALNEVAGTRAEAERLRLDVTHAADRTVATTAALMRRLLTIATVTMRQQQLETVRAAEELRISADEHAGRVRGEARHAAEHIPTH